MSRSFEFRDDLRQAVKILREGGIILYPTDTIWGVGCDATNESAVSRIYRLKKREDSKSMLVLLDHEGKLEHYISDVPAIAWELIEVSCKPLTIIYPGARNLAPNLIAEDGSIGIRITGEAFSNQLAAGLGKPVVSTSANISGTAPPERFDDISDEIRKGVDYIVQYRQDEITNAHPSSILKLGTGGQIRIIRK